MRHAASQPHVLAVDDDEGFLPLLERTLNDAGLEVSSVSCGEQAIASAQASPPDVILLDISMEMMDGFETCRRLKVGPTTADIPVIFMTAHERSAENLARAFAAGACDCITKPVSRLDVLLRVHNALRCSQQRAVGQQLDSYDPVVGLPNRIYCRARVDEELLGVARHGSDLSLIMAEIDGLDRIEADHGHQGRMGLLGKFSLVVQSEASYHDFAGCWGPEQFVLLLPRLGIGAAAGAAAAICNVWRMIETPGGETTLRSTASFGVTALSREKTATTGGDLVRSAEFALRQAQEEGGNRVVVATKPSRAPVRPQPLFGLPELLGAV